MSVKTQEVVVRSFRCLGISLPIDGSADAEISIKGLDTSRLMTALEKWETQGAPMNSGAGSSDDADESESGDSDLESESDDPFAHLTEPSVDPSRFHTTLTGSLATSLITDDPTAASLTIGDSCAAVCTSDPASVNIGSAHAASAFIDPPEPSVLTTNPQAKKGRGRGKPKQGRGSGKAATTSSSSAAASSGTRRSARLTAKPAQTYVLQFPQITDAEESDEDDGVEYDFRWQDEDL
jgi:hypothetical protein